MTTKLTLVIRCPRTSQSAGPSFRLRPSWPRRMAISTFIRSKSRSRSRVVSPVEPFDHAPLRARALWFSPRLLQVSENRLQNAAVVDVGDLVGGVEADF